MEWLRRGEPQLVKILRHRLVATWQRDLPTAVACSSWMTSTRAHLSRPPLAHRKATRTTNLLERLFGEERRRLEQLLIGASEVEDVKGALMRQAVRLRGQLTRQYSRHRDQDDKICRYRASDTLLDFLKPRRSCTWRNLKRPVITGDRLPTQSYPKGIPISRASPSPGRTKIVQPIIQLLACGAVRKFTKRQSSTYLVVLNREGYCASHWQVACLQIIKH